jgi:copper chaperone CopZ
MRTLATALAAAALLFVSAPQIAAACEGHGAPTAAKKKEAPAKVATASFKVEGMTCDGCADKVRTGLAAKDGIVKVTVSVADKRITVEYDAAKLDTGKISKLITELGYKAAAEA